MGNIPSSFSDEKSLLSLQPDALFDESFVRDKFKTSPFRQAAESFTNVTPDPQLSPEVFEQFTYMFGQSIGLEGYGRALLSFSPENQPLTELSKMRTELLARISFQTRKQIEETVYYFFFSFNQPSLTNILLRLLILRNWNQPQFLQSFQMLMHPHK